LSNYDKGLDEDEQFSIIIPKEKPHQIGLGQPRMSSGFASVVLAILT